MTIRGECLCGTVKFEIDPPTKWCAHCHCTVCRRAHGSAFVTWFGVLLEQFRIVSGEEDVRWYQSSKEAQRGFCKKCGSTMLFQSNRWADEMHIVLSNIVGEIDRSPAAHVFYDTHVEWFSVNDDLKLLGGKSGTEPVGRGLT
jgi:hypothetical protein